MFMDKTPAPVLLLQDASNAKGEIKVDTVSGFSPVPLDHTGPAGCGRCGINLEVFECDVSIGKVRSNSVEVRAEATTRYDAHQIVVQDIIKIVEVVPLVRINFELEVGKVGPILVVLQDLLLLLSKSRVMVLTALRSVDVALLR